MNGFDGQAIAGGGGFLQETGSEGDPRGRRRAATRAGVTSVRGRGATGADSVGGSRDFGEGEFEGEASLPGDAPFDGGGVEGADDAAKVRGRRRHGGRRPSVCGGLGGVYLIGIAHLNEHELAEVNPNDLAEPTGVGACVDGVLDVSQPGVAILLDEGVDDFDDELVGRGAEDITG